MVSWFRREGLWAGLVLTLNALSFIIAPAAYADVFTFNFNDGTGDMVDSATLSAGPVTATVTTGIYFLDTNEVIDAGFKVYRGDSSDPSQPTGYGVCTSPIRGFCGDTHGIDGLFGNDILLVTFDSPYAVDVLSVTFTDGDHDSNFVDNPMYDDRDQVDILVDGSFILLKQEIADGGLLTLNQDGVTTIGFGAKRGVGISIDDFFLSSITIDVFVPDVLIKKTDPLPADRLTVEPDVPEPAILSLVGISLLGLFALARTRAKRRLVRTR